MKRLLTIILLMTSISSFAQSYDVLKDENTGGPMYHGKVTGEDLAKEKTFEWYRDGANGYKQDEGAIAYLKTTLSAYTITTVMGTWCDDSHMWVPKLQAVLAATGFPASKHEIYALDRNKKGKNGEEQKYNVTMVPTIILFFGGKEVGRIVEAPKKSIEADLADMIKNFQNSK